MITETNESDVRKSTGIITSIKDFWDEHDILKIIVIFTVMAGIILWVYIASVNIDGTTGWGGECVECPAGTFTSDKGSIVCTECKPGTYSNVEGATECKQCEGDTFNITGGATECMECGGNTIATADKTGCQPCPPGSYIDPLTDICTICQKGTYNDEYDGFACTECGSGKTTRYDGANIQDLCIENKFII
jgi:hypothetical protein